MKILLAQNIDGIAGSERYLLALAAGLKRKGHIVDFLILKGAKLKVGITDFNSRISLVCDRVFKVPRTVFSIPRISNILELHEYDIVNSNLIHADLYFALIKKFFFSNFLLISTKHGYHERYLIKNGFKITGDKPFHKMVSSFAENYINHSVMVSKTLFQFYTEMGISKPNKSTVIEHGFVSNDKTFNYSKETNTKKIKIAFIGRFVEIKNPLLALSICKKLKEEGLIFQCDFFGEGPLQNHMNTIINDKDLSDVVCLRGFSNQIEKELPNYDFVLITSTAEGFGLVPLEAFSAGVIVLALNAPAINTIIKDGKTGVLFNSNEINSLVDRIKNLHFEEYYKRRIIRNAKEELKTRFDFENHLRNIEQLFNHLKK